MINEAYNSAIVANVDGMLDIMEESAFEVINRDHYFDAMHHRVQYTRDNTIPSYELSSDSDRNGDIEILFSRENIRMTRKTSELSRTQDCHW